MVNIAPVCLVVLEESEENGAGVCGKEPHVLASLRQQMFYVAVPLCEQHFRDNHTWHLLNDVPTEDLRETK